MSNVDLLRRIETLSESEIERLTCALLEGEGEKGITEGEAVMFTNWANSVIVDAVLLGLLLAGQVKARWSTEADNWVFSKVDKS